MNNPYYQHETDSKITLIQFISRAVMIILILMAAIIAVQRIQAAAYAYSMAEQTKNTNHK